MGEWWSIEVADGEFSAASWKDTHSRDLIRTALESGAEDWAWVERPWGVVLELCFPDLATVGGFSAFRDAPLVKAALDAVPDPVNGIQVYPGRGGSSGARVPRKPRPAPFSASVSLPEPETPPEFVDLAATVVLPAPLGSESTAFPD
ncbi:hypothetical protein GCM10009839_51100 [Catenulispora yoronensis]|uniref:Uncharacterized protein n=1 Tax=Catenulispora yoronensis TaxID=450799 RepID=A0ABN2USK7_9ACTN